MADEVIITTESEEVEIQVVREGSNEIPVTLSDGDQEQVIPTVDFPNTDEVQVEVTSDEDSQEVETTREWREILSYLRLVDKPAINHVILEYDKSFEELGLLEVTNSEVENMFTV